MNAWKRHGFSLAGAAVCVSLLAGCGSGSGAGPAPTPGPVATTEVVSNDAPVTRAKASTARGRGRPARKATFLDSRYGK